MPKSSWALALAGCWLGALLFGRANAATDPAAPGSRAGGPPADTVEGGHDAPPPPGGEPRAHFFVKALESGLPSHSVIALTQSRDGYLWVGTYNGLARFDGLRFTVFDPPGLGRGPIVFLFADSHGNLWVGTESAGAVLIKDGEVRPLNLSARGRAGRLVAACEETNGCVWLCTADGRLGRYLDGEMNVWQMRSPVEVGDYRALAVEAGGTLWVGAEHLLAEIDTKKVRPREELPPHPELITGKLDLLLTSARGGFWLLANGRVQRYQAKRIVDDFGPYPWGNAPVFTAGEDREGRLIVGTQNGGLTWFNAHGRAETLTSAQGLTHNTVLSLHMDREGCLWVGTDGGGLNRVTRQSFDVLPGTGTSVILSVSEDAKGGLWLASTYSELEYYLDGTFRRYGRADGFRVDSLDIVNFRSVFVDRDQRVWVGTLGGGLFQREGERFRVAPQYDALPRHVSALHQDRAGVLWVGTHEGLARWDGRHWDLFTTNNPATNGLAGNKVAAIADDAAGALWVGTDRGLSRWRDGVFTSFRAPDGLPGEEVSALLADAAGVLWVGTRGHGLARFAHGHWTRYSTENGLTDDGINYLAEDDLGYLWLGSFTGLMRIPKDDLNQLAEGRLARVRCRAYGKEDGLPTDECSSGAQPAACRTRDGRLWFPTIRGLVWVDPARLAPNTNPPPVMIEAVWVDDVLQNTNRLRSTWPGPLVVPAGKERLEIRYTSLNLLAPERARFKYQLKGHESVVDAGDSRVVRYSNLPPDRYTFWVTACNEDGVWNETGATLTILVQPPFWRTGWFLTASTAGLLGLIVATVYYVSTQRLQRQLARLKQQEALERERARIARDLHDQLGANLTQVSLLGELVEADKDSPGEVAEHAKQISQTARDTARALDEIVWAANPANDTLDGLVTYACKYAQEYLTLAGLSYRLDVPDSLPASPIPPDVRHNVFLAFKEAINNVVKHARATAVHVRLTLETDRFSLEVTDNGRGLADADRRKGRNGLRNMRKRMEDVGGEFSVEPGPEGGTRVRLTAPLSQH
jgi:signal transduction histidine kinase/ligand-binding sensor domain-containing protein